MSISKETFHINGVDNHFYAIEQRDRLTFQQFYDALKDDVMLVDNNDPNAACFPEQPAFSIIVPCIYPKSGKTCYSIAILVNEDKFVINGNNYCDLIDSFIEHEIVELWQYVRPDNPLPMLIDDVIGVQSHYRALEQQFKTAVKDNFVNRLLEYYLMVTEKYPEEQLFIQNAYNNAMICK